MIARRDERDIYLVFADWDPEAKVWVATSSDLPGLVTEAPDLDALFAKLRVMIPELLEEEGIIQGDDKPRSVPFAVMERRAHDTAA